VQLQRNDDREPVWALGAMSGTSLDGVDVAILLTDGHDIHAFGDVGFRPYSEAEQALLAAELGSWGASDTCSELIEMAHAAALAPMIDLHSEIGLIGFHGQTLAHEPRGRGTCQAGDGSILAEILQRPVVWDFRSNDVAMGGEGAPLAPFFHFACARWAGLEAPVVFLNLGGVGNITWVDPAKHAPDAPGALLAFDTGPANAPVNDLMQARFGMAFDQDGAMAARGQVADGILEAFLNDPYFFRLPPKSLDRDAFDGLRLAVADLADQDAAATLTAAAAAAVMRGMEHCPEPPAQVFVTGGGRKNPVLMAMLAAGLECAVLPVEELGLDGDNLEAQAFAYLAVRVLRGLPTSAPGTTGVAAPVGGGQISRP
jgi:anhydro-N-acetylmuramic acid kinase